jgi:hypothetical protein
MMKHVFNNKIGLIALAFGCVLMFSCVTNVLTGQTIKESRDFPAFEGVSLCFSGDVFITQGNRQKVTIEANKGTMEVIDIEVKDNTLVLKTKNGHWHDLGEIKVYITMPTVNSLSVSGSGDMICETALRSAEIKLNISGSGSIRMQQLESPNISSVITGSGDIKLAGNNNDHGMLKTTITGSGSFKAEELPVDNADITITGSGSASINVVKELETNITGSGSVLYKGNPVVNANATGSGKTRSIN